MNRLLSFVILFASSAFALAQPLYKWVEADGSITFSPTKPVAGISYETVNKATESPSLTSTALENLPPSSAKPVASDATSRIQTGSPYATIVRSNQSLQSGSAQIRRSVPGKPSSLTPDQARSQTMAVSASNNKRRRCQDLRKRVVSLERRLKSRLTPEDMDNTVVHMARYQRSFDQHCEQ